MIAFLRRFQPSHPVLATLYWIVVVAAILALLFVIFFYLDSLLNLGGGMF